LRRSTRESHGRVDHLYGSCDLADADGYRRFLTAQAAAWVTLPANLDEGSAARRDAILRDLESLGVAAPSPVAGAEVPPAGSLGLRYVLEGSRLGSTVLLRELREKAPDIAKRASRYLQSSAQVDGWKSLSTTLHSSTVNDASNIGVIADARRTFELFEQAWWATEPPEARVAS